MVYGGKPSKGCRTCRARRIKCDEGKPTCQRCAKSKRECGGYRPEFDFVHRDQTSFTLRRANEVEEVAKTASSSSSSSPPSSSSSSPPSSSSSATVTSPPLWPSPTNILTIPLAQRATCHFASNFILIPLDTAPHGFLDYLVPLIRSEPQGSSLRYALNACAFALLSNRAKADAVNLSKLSLKEHTLALAETYRALANPKTATSDATLAAVLLLSLYETITARKETRMLAWRSHIDGAVNIVQTRGSEMCRTKIGALLFAAVRQQLISRTLSSGIPLPLGTDWWLQDGYSNTLLSTAQRFALECADIKTELSHILATCPKSPESFQLVRKESQRIQDLDHSIANWLVSIPQDFRFTTICWVWEDDLGLSKGGSYAEVDVFPGRVDVYPDYVTASAWNLAHVTRLILASCDIRATAWICAPADYKDTSEYATSRRICEGTISEVLASVPYHFGWHLNRGKGGLLSDISGFACGDEAGQLKALPAFFLLWSITCVKNIDIATPEQRAWAKGRLKAISEQIGLRYAQVVNDAEFRFPSMLILQDAMAARSTDPFYRSVQAAPVPSRVEPLTPESMSSVKGSPSP